MIYFIAGFFIGGIVGCDSPRANTNTPPIQPKRPRKYK